MQSIEILIQVQPLRHSKSAEEVAGRYQVFVPADIEPGNRADIAIESFHRAIPVSNLEDFEITISDARSGQEIVPTYEEVGTVFDCKKYEEDLA